MRILSLDTSATDTASIAVLEDREVLHSEIITGRASATLFPALEKIHSLWEKAPIITVGVGPGSFSGIRVSIALAQGLRTTIGCEIIPVRSSNAVARQHRETTFLGIFANARREEYFVTCYENGKLTRPTQLVLQSQLEDFLSKCTLAVSADPIAHIPERSTPSAVELALDYLDQGAEAELALDPIYLRPAV